MITVLTKQPGEDLQQEEWEDASLYRMQKAVGGLIESAVEGPDWICYCNEEGRLRGMEPNFRRSDGHIIVGPVVFVGVDFEEGDEVGLTVEQITLLKQTFGA